MKNNACKLKRDLFKESRGVSASRFDQHKCPGAHLQIFDTQILKVEGLQCAHLRRMVSAVQLYTQVHLQDANKA